MNRLSRSDSHDNGHDYALLELRAPASVESTDAVAQDVYFLVDRSGSMQGQKWQKAIQALQGCIGALGAKDRVAVTLFESTFQDFDAEPASPAALMADPRFRQLAAVGTARGTELEPALRHVLKQVERFSKDRPAALVLITDAEIGNEREIVALMRQHPPLPVHCFGIDTTLNDSLLLDLVRQQGGTFLALQPKEDVAGIVTQLGRTLRQPVLVNFQSPAGWELAAGAIPNLYAGQIHLISVRSPQGSGANAFTVEARDHRNNPVSLEFKLTAVQESGPRLRWCKERLVTLVAQDDKPAAVALSKEANLLCPLTAFVAWDEQEKVAVANHRLVQPALLPTADRLLACATMDPMAGGLFRELFIARSRQLPSALHEDFAGRISAKTAGTVSPSLDEDPQRLDLLERISDFRLPLRAATGNNDCANSLLELEAWVLQAADQHGLDLAARLLDGCQQHLEEWLRHEQHLRVVTTMLAEELEQSASVLRKVWEQKQGPRPILQRVQETLSQCLAGNAREKVSDLVNKMTHLETEICARIKEFLRQQAGTPSPQGITGLVKKVQDATRNMVHGKDQDGENKVGQ